MELLSVTFFLFGVGVCGSVGSADGGCGDDRSWRYSYTDAFVLYRWRH